MLTQLLEYIKNNPQEVMFQAVLSIVVIILAAAAATIWINQYRYRKHYGSGKKYYQSGVFDKAIEELKIALKLAKKPLSGKKRDVENTSRLLAEAAIASARWDEAVEALNQCIAISPEKTEYHVSLVESYLKDENDDRARDALDKALQLIRPAGLEELAKERTFAVKRNRKEREVEKELGQLTRSMAVCQSERLDKLEILKPDFQGRKIILEGVLDGEEDIIDLAKFYLRQYILEKNAPERRTSEKGSEPDHPVEEKTQKEMPEDMEIETTPLPDDPERQEETETEETGTRAVDMEEPPEESLEVAPLENPPEEPEPSQSPESHLASARAALDSLEMEPLSAAFYTLSAYLSIEEEEPEAAEESYERAISLNPQYDEAYYNLALLCVDEFHDMERAIGYFRNALESNPQYAEAHHNLALLLLGFGADTREEVKHHLGEAIRIDPRFSEIYYNLALLLARKDVKEFLLG